MVVSNLLIHRQIELVVVEPHSQYKKIKKIKKVLDSYWFLALYSNRI